VRIVFTDVKMLEVNQS